MGKRRDLFTTTEEVENLSDGSVAGEYVRHNVALNNLKNQETAIARRLAEIERRKATLPSIVKALEKRKAGFAADSPAAIAERMKRDPEYAAAIKASLGIEEDDN